MSDLSMQMHPASEFIPDTRFSPVSEFLSCTDTACEIESVLTKSGLAAWTRAAPGMEESRRTAPAVAESLSAPSSLAKEPRDPLEKALTEAYTSGLAAGHTEAESMAEMRRGVLQRFAFAFNRINADLSELFAQRLTETVVALCETSLAPLALDHEALARRAERAAMMFVRADDERVIRLNPDDLADVAALLPQEWNFVADPALQPGALRIETSTGGVEDGPAQWSRAIREAIDPLGPPLDTPLGIGAAA